MTRAFAVASLLVLGWVAQAAAAKLTSISTLFHLPFDGSSLVAPLTTDLSANQMLELGWVKSGARVGITAGLPSGRPGTTSLFQIQRV